MLTIIIRFLNRLTTLFVAGIFGVLVLMIFTQVVLRYVFASSLLWVEEMGKFMFMWLMWFGITIGVLKKSHIAVDFFVNLLPDKFQKWVRMISVVITGGFFLVLSYLGVTFAVKNIAAESSVLLIPIGYVYMILPVCGLICVIYCVQQVLDILVNRSAKEA